MQLWKTVEKKIALSHSKFLTVENHAVELPDGRIISDWSWVVTPNFVNVVAVTTDDRFLCFQQTKYAVGATVGIVGGYIEPSEDPETAARRELMEETGHTAAELVPLGNYAVDANRGCGTGHFFLALGCEKVAEPDADDLEDLSIVYFSRTELENILQQGGFKVMPWVSAISLALLQLNKRALDGAQTGV